MAVAAFLSHTCCGAASHDSTLPTRLSDEQFWDLSTRLSEPAGTFAHSENLVSNEPYFVHAIRMLRPTGGVYIGVGPEQNFNYIARLRPELAFIIDIRRENRNLHLLYKALFELSADRADFLSRLFSRPRPSGLHSDASVGELFTAYAVAQAEGRLYDQNLHVIRERLLEVHGLPLVSQDLEWIGYALRAFYTDGPEIQYGRSRPRDAPGPSYRVLMTARDVAGQTRSYLASEEGFAYVKDLHARNLIVPVVGDFSGPHAIRRTGEYIRHHHAIVSAFYSSNVEVYLVREARRAFCNSLGTLPHDSASWFIGSKGVERLEPKMKSCAPGPPHPTWTPPQ
jgi:hypothetical protein